MSERTPQDERPRWHTAIPAGALSGSEQAVVEERLAQAAIQGASGAERMDAGTLLFGSSGGFVTGILMPPAAPSASLDVASEDLVQLLAGAARRPILERIEAEGEQPIESLGSISLRLAYQLERILDAEVIVAVTTKESVKVMGVSGRADRRLLDTTAMPGSPLEQVGRGEMRQLSTIADPLGGIVPDRRSRFAPALILPIRGGGEDQAGEVVGAVAFWSEDDSAPIAPVIAEVQEAMRNAGPRIVRALREETTTTTALTDPLTGLRNRRGLDDVMGRIGVQQASLIYCDLDKFKTLNDTLGHPAGDAVLVHFARLLTDQIRGADTAARIGGEEFAVWLPGANLSYGYRIADRIRIKLGTAPWDWQGKNWPLSASFGVAAVPDTTRSIGNLMSQADAALLVAKRDGRNRVETARRIEG
jgi:diguanylate cyclase (GGDEF)-like protein